MQKPMKYTLVVVDMQPSFKAALDKPTQRAVAREIRAALRGGNPVVILEYDGYGPTVRSISRYAPRRHPLVSYQKKYENDGSPEVCEVVQQQEWPSTFRVCGVNAGACVLDTVEQLAEVGPVTVPAAACNCTCVNGRWCPAPVIGQFATVEGEWRIGQH